MRHETAVRQKVSGNWQVACTCGWESREHLTRELAETHAHVHLTSQQAIAEATPTTGPIETEPCDPALHWHDPMA